jgi:general secretion pathway protein J
MNRSARGFTLLEVLFALALMGVLLTLVATTVLLGQRALAHADRYAQRLDEVRAAQGFLRQAVQQTLPLQYGGSGPMSVFEGQAHSFRFAAPVPTALSGGILWHTVEWADAPSGPGLRVRFESAPGRTWGEPQWLLQGVRAVHLSYRGTDAAGRQTDWLARWPWPRRLPGQVRIALEVTGPVAWTAQTIALRLDLSGAAVAP